MQFFKKSRNMLVFLGLILGFVLTPLEGAVGDKQSVYFYNPETNIDNFALLKKEFDAYLARYGNYDLLPFSKAEPFEAAVARAQSGLFILSSWHLKIMKKSSDLQPVLVAVIKGASTHKKVLATKQGILSPKDLRGLRVASSASKDYTLEILKEMIGAGNSDVVTSLQILTVPKDIDALMSVAFGMAESALTTRDSLDQLAVMNPTQHKRLTVLAESDELLLPIVAVNNTQLGKTKALIDILARMGPDPKGEEQLHMLGLNGFRPLVPADKKRLER